MKRQYFAVTRAAISGLIQVQGKIREVWFD